MKTYEQKLLKVFLGDLYTRYANSSCNDFILKWYENKCDLTEQEIQQLNEDYNEVVRELDEDWEDVEHNNEHFIDTILLGMIVDSLNEELQVKLQHG